MRRVAAFVVVLGGCIIVPPQSAAPPPQGDPAAPAPRRVVYADRRAPAPDDAGDDEASPTPSPNDDVAPHRGHGHHESHDRDDDDYNWPPAGSEDPFGLGKDWKQYTTAEIQRLPAYEPGRAYKVGAVVQEPWSIPRTHVYRCSQPAGCMSREPSANAAGWDNIGWYDARAPRYVRRMPLPPLKPGENPFPSDGKPLGDDEADSVPSYANGTTYPYGALVKVGYATVPHEIVYKCNAKQCDRSPSGNAWTAYGWRGREL